MVWHLVLAKPKAAATADERAALVEALRRAASTIPTIRAVRVGRRISHGAGYETHAPDAAEYVALIEFDDVSALQAYLRHPAHDELATRFGQALQSPVIYDFEETSLDRLA